MKEKSYISADNGNPSEKKIVLRYTYEMDGGFFIGYLDDYPEYPTQGESLEDFEENLLDIFKMIQNGTLDVSIKHGVLEVFVWIAKISYI